ncbi:MAG: hypothetical protein KBD04_02815 [Proteobacteria bacterium]|nr:hypothetical protein [Pseudomonadota bacterium]
MKKFLILATVLILNHSLYSMDAPFEEERESTQKVTPQQLLDYLVAGSVSPESPEFIEALSTLSEEQQVDFRNILLGLSPVRNTRLNAFQYFIPINAKIDLVRCLATLESSQWTSRINATITEYYSSGGDVRNIYITETAPQVRRKLK